VILRGRSCAAKQYVPLRGSVTAGRWWMPVLLDLCGRPPSPLSGTEQDVLMSPLDRPRLLTSICEVLRRASVPVPTWHLAPRDRWVMLRDTLLGHAPIRGGLRPRDLPFDPDAREAIHMAADVHGLEPYEVRKAIPSEIGASPLQAAGKPGTITFRDWLVCYSALVEHRLRHDPENRDPVCRSAVYDCIAELRRALGFNERGGDTPEQCPFVHRMLGLLGLSQQEWSRLAAGGEDRQLARLGALLRTCDLRQSDRNKFDAADQAKLGMLESKRFRVITIKTSKVQEYLARGRYHWLMRGASTWCAQALALTRDLVLSDNAHAEGAFLLSDSDAIVSFLGPEEITVDGIAESLGKRIVDFWDDDTDGKADSDERFPRLRAWRERARCVGVSPSSVMPDVVVTCSDPITLADLCCVHKTGEGPEPHRRVLGWRKEFEGDSQCGYVECDRSLGTDAPEWLRPEGRKSSNAMGWTSIVWTLCGATFRTHAYEGLAAKLALPDLSLAPVDQGKWLEGLGRQNEPLVYLKIDGDSIGDRFKSSRIPELPGLGLALVQSVFRRLVAAARDLLAAGGSGPAAGLPLDLVYLGGDDLLCCVPQGLLPTLLESFGREQDARDPWASVTFTFAAIELPPKSDMDTGSGRELLKRLTSGASRAIGPALEYAKALTKGRAELLDEKEVALRGALTKAGAKLTHVGQVEQFGCVRGIRMRVAPQP